MMRSIGAVAAGFVFIMVLSFAADAVLRHAMPARFRPDGGSDDLLVLALCLAYVFVFATAGCFVCARIAGHHPMRHAIILGVIGLVLNLGAAIAVWHTAPAWYHVANLLLVMPAAWLGGRLRLSQLSGQAVAAPS
jgi:hypothetical protein